MKYVILFIALACPVAAQDYSVRPSDDVPDKARLAGMILDRDLEYFDGGVSCYGADGGYTWTYADPNGGGVFAGRHDVRDAGVVCITYDAGQEPRDMFVVAGDRLVLLMDDGQRYPLRDIR